MEGIERMSQIAPNSIPNDGSLRIIPTHPRPQPINLQHQKSPQSQKQMTQDRDGFAHLCFPHPTTLFQRSMINFYPPSPPFQLLSLSLAHPQIIGCPVFRVSVFRDSPKDFDEPKALQMHHPPLTLLDQPISLPIGVHQSLDLENDKVLRT